MRAVAETLKRTTFYGRRLELAPGSNIIRILEALRERDNVIVEDNLSSASDDSDSDSSMIIERAPPTTRNHRLLATLDTSECLTCKVVKMTKLPVHASKRQTSRPGQTIGTDLIGPFDVEGMGRKRYTQTFVDFHTRFETVHNLYSKTESSAIAQRVIGKTEMEQRAPVESVRLDNGTELNEFSTWATTTKSPPITLEFSPPDVPELNGRTERQHQRLVRTASALLTTARLPKSFWPPAMEHA